MCRRAILFLMMYILMTDILKGGAFMHEDRRFLRALLSALIAERDDAQLLYGPRGEDGMRRMIRALLDLRAPRENDPLEEMIKSFRREQR